MTEPRPPLPEDSASSSPPGITIAVAVVPPAAGEARRREQAFGITLALDVESVKAMVAENIDDARDLSMSDWKMIGERLDRALAIGVLTGLLVFIPYFAGVLLALPASAALLVGLRHLRAAYFDSPVYRGSQ